MISLSAVCSENTVMKGFVTKWENVGSDGKQYRYGSPYENGDRL